MGRLVDEDDVLKVLCRQLCHPGAICPDRYCEEMREKLKDVPTAHPEPQKMGRWIANGDPLMLTCGNCGYSVMRYNNTPFCPNCGAKMEKIYDYE